MGKTFAEVWTEAQRERSEYYRSIWSGMWSSLLVRGHRENEAEGQADSLQLNDLPKAA